MSSSVRGFEEEWKEIFDNIVGIPELVSAITLIGNAAKQHKLRLDIHSGNVMKRQDGTIVITDPYIMDGQ